MRSWRSAISANSALLLDPQGIVWMAPDDDRLSRRARENLADGRVKLQISGVTAFEYSDLRQRRRLPIDQPLEDICGRFELEVVDFPASAWRRVAQLPDIRRDPVDRMVIAHAIDASLPLVTADRTVHRYPLETIW